MENIEKILLDYLSGVLSVPVLMELPEVPSEEYPVMPSALVVLDKTAGSMHDYVWTATFAIQSYGRKKTDASALNLEVHEAMLDMPGAVDEISGCEMVADAAFTDVRTKRYRYQSVYNIFY